MADGCSSPEGNSGLAEQEQTGGETMEEPWRKLTGRELRGNSVCFPAVKRLKILDYVECFESHGISAAALLSIQVSSSGQCRVTFSEQSFAASICNHGCNLKGSHIFLLAVDESLNSIQIHIHDVPIWVSNAAVGLHYLSAVP